MARRSKKNGNKFVLIVQSTLKSKQWHDLSTRGKMVWIHLLMNLWRDKKVNPTNRVKMTQKQIEQFSGLSHPTVVSGIKDLEDAGFLTTAVQGGLERNASEYDLESRYVWD